jgi:hypothetical protein
MAGRKVSVHSLHWHSEISEIYNITKMKCNRQICLTETKRLISCSEMTFLKHPLLNLLSNRLITHSKTVINISHVISISRFNFSNWGQLVIQRVSGLDKWWTRFLTLWSRETESSTLIVWQNTDIFGESWQKCNQLSVKFDLHHHLHLSNTALLVLTC